MGKFHSLMLIFFVCAQSAFGLSIVNNCDHDVYVATSKGISSAVAGGAVAVHTDGWFRITRYQTKNFDTRTVRILVKGTVLTNRDEQNQLVSYACAKPDTEFKYRIWHSGVNGERKDPAQECLYSQKGRWLAFEYMDKNEIVIEGLSCVPAASILHNHFAAYDQTNQPVHFLKLRSATKDRWTLITATGSTALHEGLGTDDQTWELAAEGNGKYRGKWFKITMNGRDIYWSTDRRSWTKFGISGGWQNN